MPDPDPARVLYEFYENYSEKLIYLNKHAQFKNIKSFLSKKISLIGSLLVIICNLTHLQDGNTKVKFMLNIRKVHVGSETN
jgi:hypothetical protein